MHERVVQEGHAAPGQVAQVSFRRDSVPLGCVRVTQTVARPEGERASLRRTGDFPLSCASSFSSSVTRLRCDRPSVLGRSVLVIFRLGLPWGLCAAMVVSAGCGDWTHSSIGSGGTTGEPGTFPGISVLVLGAAQSRVAGRCQRDRPLTRYAVIWWFGSAKGCASHQNVEVLDLERVLFDEPAIRN